MKTRNGSRPTFRRVFTTAQSFLAVSGVCLFLSAWPAQSQTINTFAGNGNPTTSGDGGLATLAGINQPSGLAIDSGGSVYIAEAMGFRVRRVNPSGIISTFAGSGQFAEVNGLAIDSAGTLYIADSGNRQVRKVTAAGIVTTIAGIGTQGLPSSGDGGQGVNAQLARPIALALDGAGNLYICDSSNHNIRKLNLSTGIITTYAGNGTGAGIGPGAFSGDGGQAVSASLNYPLGLAMDRAGNLYIADAGNSCVRKVTPGGIITTVAGRGGVSGPTGDGGPATSALLNLPEGITVDSSGSLFISDSENGRIRRVDGASGYISTIAGGGSTYGDGGPAINAQLNFPWHLAIDGSGALYVSDIHNNNVRKISGATTGPLPLPSPPPAPPPPPPPSTSVPRVISLTPPVATGNTQQYTMQVSDASGWQDLDVVNLLINRFQDGRQACYLAYSRTNNVLYLVPDSGVGLSQGMSLPFTGTLNNSQCSITAASASGGGNTLTLTVNLSFSTAFGGDRAVFAAARSLTENSGWETMGVVGINPLPSSLPNAVAMTPSSGSTANAMLAFTYQDATAPANLLTAWALIKDALDGRQACYIAYNRPGNFVLLFPDSGDPTQAPTMTLAGTNSVSNSQCTVSAQGSSVSLNGSQMTVNLNVTFKPAFAGPKAVWMAVQNVAGQVSPWRSLGEWQVPGN